MADDVSDEPPVGDARTSWLPAQSAQILALGDAARRRNAAYQNAWQKLQPPAKTQPLKSSERRSLRQTPSPTLSSTSTHAPRLPSSTMSWLDLEKRPTATGAHESRAQTATISPWAMGPPKSASGHDPSVSLVA